MIGGQLRVARTRQCFSIVAERARAVNEQGMGTIPERIS